MRAFVFALRSTGSIDMPAFNRYPVVFLKSN